MCVAVVVGEKMVADLVWDAVLIDLVWDVASIDSVWDAASTNSLQDAASIDLVWDAASTNSLQDAEPTPTLSLHSPNAPIPDASQSEIPASDEEQHEAPLLCAILTPPRHW